MQAVILSGGGANGAYEVGVLKGFCSGQSHATGQASLDPDIFAGTSIGSFNAAFLVSNWDTYRQAAVTNLETIWLDRLGRNEQTGSNGGYRFLAKPLEFLGPQAINDVLVLIARADQESNDPGVDEKGVMRALVKFGAHLEHATHYKPLKIHRYHPRDELGGPLSLLDLRRARIEYLIERGFHDAVSHNCQVSQCVLPESQVAMAGDKRRT